MYGIEALAEAEADRVEQMVKDEIAKLDEETVEVLKRRYCTPKNVSFLPDPISAFDALRAQRANQHCWDSGWPPFSPVGLGGQRQGKGILSGIFGGLLQ